MSKSVRVRKGFPCPVCGEEVTRCQIIHGGAAVNCYNVRSPDSALLGELWTFSGFVSGGPGGATVVRRRAAEVPARRRGTTPAAATQAEETPAPDEPVVLEGDALAEARAYQKQRDAHFKRLVAFAETLDQEEASNLIGRGLSMEQVAELNEMGFRKVNANTHSSALAGGIGFDNAGRYLGQEGILIPSMRKTSEGVEYLGFQVAVCKSVQEATGAPKYLYLSGGAELEERRSSDYLAVINEDGSKDSAPLFSYVPEGQKIDRAVLTDGALKAVTTGMRLGVAGIGSPGAGYTAQMGQLKQLLGSLVAKNSELMVCLAADAGDPNNANMMGQLVIASQTIQSWGYGIRWIELEQEKGKGEGVDIDETLEDPQRTLTASEFLRKSLTSIRKSAERRAAQRWEWGFRPWRETDDVELPFCHTEPELYPAGQRTEIVADKIKQGHRVIVDRTGTGGGKSFWWANLSKGDLQRLGVENVLVLSPRHMEQGEEFGVAYIRGRQPHGAKITAEGRILTVQGHQDIDAGRGERLFKKGNCVQGRALMQLQQRNMMSGLGSLCTNCPVREMCELTEGGYRHDREEARQKPVAVLHPAALQEQLLTHEKEDAGRMPRTGVVLDDVAIAAMTETIVVPLDSLRRTIALAAHGGNIAMQKLTTVAGKLDRGSVDANKLEREVLPQLREVLSTADNNTWASLIDLEEANAIESPDTDPWLCSLPFLRDWIGGNAVAFVNAQGELSIQRYNQRILTALRSAAWVLVLDATASVRVMEALYKTEPVVIAEETYLTPADLTVNQVMGLGTLGFGRKEQDVFRTKVLLKVMRKRGLLDPTKTAVVDSKKHLDATKEFGKVSLTWMADSRGSNRAYAAGCTHLLMVGSPNTNLGAAGVLFQLLFGRSVDVSATAPVVHEVLQVAGEERMVCCGLGSEDAEFGAFYTMLRQTEQVQALGRLRASRREGEHLHVTLLGDSVAPFPVQLQSLPQVIDDDNALDLMNCTDTALRGAAFQLRTKGRAVTPDTIAEEAGLHPRLVREWFGHQDTPPWWLTQAQQPMDTSGKGAVQRQRRHRAPRATRTRRTTRPQRLAQTAPRA